MILSLSRLTRPSSLFNLWTMSSTSSYCRSADVLGEPGCDCGTGDGGSVGDLVAQNTISDSSTSLSGTRSLCLFSRAASRCVFLLLLFVDDFIVGPRERENINLLAKKNLPNLSLSSSLIVLTSLGLHPRLIQSWPGHHLWWEAHKKIQESQFI